MGTIVTKTKATMQYIRENVRRERRNWTWTIHTLLSMIVMCAVIDAIPLSNMNNKQIFAFSVSGSSLIVSLIISAMHYIEYSKRFVGGTLSELFMAALLLGLWIAAAVVIQDPQNNIASTVRPEGVEWIRQANIYFFTWFALFCNLFLVGSFFRNYMTYDLRVMAWISLLSSSLILLGVSSHLKEGICTYDNGSICFRTKYAMLSGGIVGGISLIASVLSYMSKVSPSLGLILASPNALIYSFGVVILTSASGPGRTLGTIYFTIWIGSIISFLLLIGEFNEIFFNEDKEEKITSKSDSHIIEAKVVGDDPIDTDNSSEDEALDTENGVSDSMKSHKRKTKA